MKFTVLEEGTRIPKQNIHSQRMLPVPGEIKDGTWEHYCFSCRKSWLTKAEN
jgi:hypothetical protein